MIHRIAIPAISIILLAACDKKDTSSVMPDTGRDFEAFFDSTPVADALDIHVARESVQAGSEITIQGRVMGRSKPFVDGRAAFVLGDDTLLTPCNEKPDDPCPTPWDVCCDSPEDKRIGTATIQIVDADGRVASGSLRGVNGLAELSRVTVNGTVAEGSGVEALIVNATSIHVHP